MAGENLQTLALNAVRLAERLGAGEAEAFLDRAKVVSVSIENGQLVKAKTLWETGLGLRVSLKGRIGFAYLSMPTSERLEEAVGKAIKLAKVSQPLEGWKGFPSKKPHPKPSGILHGEVASASVEEAARLAGEMLEAALKLDGRVIASDGGVSLTFEERFVVNSLGVEAGEEATWASCF
ncbi:hypothetical protein DRO53_02625, partial [Candidatus Bathyarchaeota archaeon]